MRATIIKTPAYELSADIEHSGDRFSVELLSFVPTARRPEVQRKLQTSLTRAELRALGQLIDGMLTAHPEPAKPVDLLAGLADVGARHRPWTA